uniref:Ig-like domain-containing protein n=1 Tax=Anas platyrhynchos TaxID=8839 RepID=A0A8B9SJ49_ANAPL
MEASARLGRGADRGQSACSPQGGTEHAALCRWARLPAALGAQAVPSESRTRPSGHPPVPPGLEQWILSSPGLGHPWWGSCPWDPPLPGDLLVSRVTPQDSGLYVCKAKNSVGETYAAEEEGCPGSQAPIFLVGPSSLRVCRGEDVTFSCRVSGSHFAVGQAGSREALAAAVLLVEPRATDGTPGGSPSNGPQLLAQPQPRRHRHAGSDTWAPVPNGVPGAKAFAVSAGKHAKFRCYVTGKPKPEIIWQKDGKALAPSRRHLIYEDREGYFILKVLYCKPQDQGLYVCTASNTAGQTLSAVQLRVKGRCAPREGFVGSGFAWQASVRAGAPGEHAAPWSPSQMGLWDHGCGTIPTPHLPCAQHCPAPRTVLGARSCSPNNSLPRCRWWHPIVPPVRAVLQHGEALLPEAPGAPHTKFLLPSCCNPK